METSRFGWMRDLVFERRGGEKGEGGGGELQEFMRLHINGNFLDASEVHYKNWSLPFTLQVFFFYILYLSRGIPIF